MSTLKIAVITFDIKTEGLGKVKIKKKFLSFYFYFKEENKKERIKQKEVTFYSCSRGFFSLFLTKRMKSFFASAEDGKGNH